MRKFIFVVPFLFLGCDNSSNYTPASSGSSNSFEHNYVKNRFKAEGYSNKDSETAAKAIMKFHEAQKKR